MCNNQVIMSIIKAPKISIIVPVYNTSRYLPRCIDSLISQTIKDIEIIIINDGSIDNSQSIIDKYANSHPHIVALVQSNSGVSAARNLGLKSAQGEYIGFVDSDDWCEITMFEKLYNLAKINSSDIACCNYMHAYHDCELKVDTVTQAIANKFTMEPCLVNRIIKTSFWNKNNLQFTKGITHEDFEIHYKLCALTNNISFTHEYLYFYEKSNITSYTHYSTLKINDLDIVCHNLLNWQHDKQIMNPLFINSLQKLVIFYTLNQPDSKKAKELWLSYKIIIGIPAPTSYLLSIVKTLYSINFWIAHSLLRQLYRIKKLIK